MQVKTFFKDASQFEIDIFMSRVQINTQYSANGDWEGAFSARYDKNRSNSFSRSRKYGHYGSGGQCR